jgi:hypothetical protein
VIVTHGHEFSADGKRYLLGSLPTVVDANWGIHACKVFPAYSCGHKAAEDLKRLRPRTDHPDVTVVQLALQKCLQHSLVAHVPVRENDMVSLRAIGGRLNQFHEIPGQEVVRVRDTTRSGKLRPIVQHRHFETDKRGECRQKAADVPGAVDIQKRTTSHVFDVQCDLTAAQHAEAVLAILAQIEGDDA